MCDSFEDVTRYCPEILNECYAVIQGQIKRGIVKRVSKQRLYSTNHQIHYMPLHPVIQRGRSITKVRVVYDSSVKLNESYLSACLLMTALIPKPFDFFNMFSKQLYCIDDRYSIARPF